MIIVYFTSICVHWAVRMKSSCYFTPCTCLAPSTTGTIHSGSVAWVLSSIRMERNCILARRGSPAPTQVQQMTSAFWAKKTISKSKREGRKDIMRKRGDLLGQWRWSKEVLLCEVVSKEGQRWVLSSDEKNTEQTWATSFLVSIKCCREMIVEQSDSFHSIGWYYLLPQQASF